MFQLFEYQLPFRRVFQTGSRQFQSRKGVLLRYQERKIDFVVEASPLPGFSSETFSEVKDVLLNQKRFVDHFLHEDLSLQKIRDLAHVQALKFPSIQFSLSFLALSILAFRQQQSIYDLFHQKPPHRVKINDVVGHGSIAEMKQQIETSVKKGFQTIKIKALHPVDDLATLLLSIYKKHPNLQFRLDANQSWPRSELKNNSDKLRHLPIEYIEEPCRRETLSDIKEIQKHLRFPLALDESISSLKKLKKVLATFPDLVVIIKPMVLGNFLEIHETISSFRSCFKQIAVTTTLESKIGRSTIASSAFLLGDPQMSHGLHTGHLLADDLLPDFEIKNGSIKNLRENPAIQSFSQIKKSYIKNLD